MKPSSKITKAELQKISEQIIRENAEGVFHVSLIFFDQDHKKDRDHLAKICDEELVAYSYDLYHVYQYQMMYYIVIEIDAEDVDDLFEIGRKLGVYQGKNEN